MRTTQKREADREKESSRESSRERERTKEERLTTGISEREDKVEGLVVPRQDLDFSAGKRTSDRIASHRIASHRIDQIGERKRRKRRKEKEEEEIQTLCEDRWNERGNDGGV